MNAMNAWVLLRGLTRESAHWGDFPALLAARFPGVPVATIDLPGNGSAHRERSPSRVADIAQACRASLAVRGLEPPFGVVAMSLGAMVAVDWARARPGDIARAVLINTSLRPFSPFYERLRPSAWAGLVHAAVTRDALAREREVWQLTSRRPIADRADVIRDWARIQRARPVTLRNAARQLWAAASYRAALTAPATPLLMLCSARDALVNPRCSHVIAERWGAHLHTHPWAGHDLPLDDPQWVVERIEQHR